MKVLAVLLIAVAIATAQVKDTEETRAQFKLFKETYNKHYLLAGENEQRYFNFLKTLERIEKKNNANNGAVFGVTKFSDLSEQELMHYKMPAQPAQALARSCLAPNVTAAEILDSGLLKAAPVSFDWRTKGVVSPVKNQQQCGSCWTFSVTGNIESLLAISGKPMTLLSEQNIVDCSTGCSLVEGQSVCNSGCNGGWPWAAMNDIMSWGGLATESVYPYTAEDGTCNTNIKQRFGKLSNYTCIGTDENQILLQLLARGPLSIALNAGLVEDYSSGIIVPSSQNFCDPTQLDHAVLLVGYGVDNTQSPPQKFWIIKNSWGATWGEQGYFRMARGIGACGMNNAVVSADLAK